MTRRFEWDAAKAAINYRRHGIHFQEAMAAFVDPFALIEFDNEHSEFESRERLIGRGARRVLFVIFTERDETAVRIISARKTTREERRRYEENKLLPL